VVWSTATAPAWHSSPCPTACLLPSTLSTILERRLLLPQFPTRYAMAAGGTIFCLRCILEVVFKCFICIYVCFNGYIRTSQVYVSRVLDLCFTRFICMFHLFYLDVAKGSNVAYVATARHVFSSVCPTCFICFKRMFQMFQLFSTHVLSFI
jgi:hypothetical protein